MSLGRFLSTYAIPEPAPDGTGDTTSRTGWRSWVWDEESGYLHSRGSQAWLPGEPYRAACESERFMSGLRRATSGTDPLSGPDAKHTAPEPCCECGIHAFRDYEDVNVLAAEISGLCALWGTVLEHERGYRASQAYPVQLLIHTDGAADGDDRATRIAERLASTYSFPVGVMDYAGVDHLLASTLRDAPAPRGQARISSIAWAARDQLDGGNETGAFETVLRELRHIDLRQLRSGGQMGQGLPAPFFLHESESRRWISSVDGEFGAQRIRVMSLKGQAPLYHGPQYVDMDTSTGSITERIEGCAGPRHRGHWQCKDRPADEAITITRIGAGLRLESWIQLLYWASDPQILASAASLRNQRGTGVVSAVRTGPRRQRKIRRLG